MYVYFYICLFRVSKATEKYNTTQKMKLVTNIFAMQITKQ